MLCQSCGQFEANVHLTHVVDDASREVHLCEECAAKNGIKVDSPMSLTDILVGLGEFDSANDETAHKTCPLCGLTLGDFRKSSQIGCPVCYETFRAELSQLLAGVHKGDQHLGKVPVSAERLPANSSAWVSSEIASASHPAAA